jgi:2-methylcitrate dehydratase PrpD
MAMTDLMRAHPVITAELIETIDVETFHESVCLQGHFPKNADEAQYALAFPLAALIVRGKLGPKEVTGDSIHAPDILSISEKITLHEAPDLSARFPEEILSRVTVTLKDGTRLTSPTATAKGDPGNPMSSAELTAKYHLLADDSLGSTLSNAIKNSVETLPESDDCQSLFDLLLSAPKTAV